MKARLASASLSGHGLRLMAHNSAKQSPPAWRITMSIFSKRLGFSVSFRRVQCFRFLDFLEMVILIYLFFLR